MRFTITALCSLLLLTGVSLGDSPEQHFFPYKHEKFTLPNGFKTIFIPIKGSGLVSYYTVVRTGSRDEWEPGKSGFAHFFEHMMFRGTKNIPAEEYDHTVTEMGADNNAYTTDDYTCYTMTLSSESIETAMRLESDRFQNLSYEKGPFQTESGAVYGEYRKGRVSPWSVAHEVLSNLAFDTHTYKHTTIGFEADIKDMPNQYEYSKSFFQRYYRPENCILLLVGDFDPASVKPLVEKYYGDWKTGYVAPKIAPEPEQKGERSKEVEYEGRTLPLIWMAYKSDDFEPEDKTYAAGYLLWELAFGENSELYKKLVIREQKVQFIGGGYNFNRDPKFNSIYTMVKSPDDLDYVKTQIDATAEKFKTEPVSETDLEKLKKRTRYGFLMDLDTPKKVASNLARYIALAGDVSVIDQLDATMQSVTPADVQAAAKRYLQKDHRTVITLKEKKDEAE